MGSSNDWQQPQNDWHQPPQESEQYYRPPETSDTAYQHAPHQPPGSAPFNSSDPSPLAWMTLAAGLASWVFMPFLGAIAAVIAGFIERRKIAEGQSSKAGSTVVLIGMILGGIQLLLSFLIMMGVMFMFFMMFLAI